MIVVEDVHKHFGGFRAVDGATLEIAEGSITGLIGPNGAGKTTLFNVIAGVLKPTSGRVTMDGEDSSEVWASFRVGRRARVRDASWSTVDGRGSFSGEHDGYALQPYAIRATFAPAADANEPNGSHDSAKAIELNWYEDDQILCKLDALLEGVI